MVRIEARGKSKVFSTSSSIIIIISGESSKNIELFFPATWEKVTPESLGTEQLILLYIMFACCQFLFPLYGEQVSET